ncbi:hypothetical protein MJO29_001142, partial [Puccinia striiformis f. sp. tritici]
MHCFCASFIFIQTMPSGARLLADFTHAIAPLFFRPLITFVMYLSPMTPTYNGHAAACKSFSIQPIPSGSCLMACFTHATAVLSCLPLRIVPRLDTT